MRHLCAGHETAYPLVWALLDQVSDAEARASWRIHSIHRKRSGILLDGDPEKVVGVLNDHMFRVEIPEGSGKKALEQRRVSLKAYYRAVALRARIMDCLNDNQPTLVHGSPIPWSTYLTKEDDRWQVTKLTALGVQWWD